VCVCESVCVCVFVCVCEREREREREFTRVSCQPCLFLQSTCMCLPKLSMQNISTTASQYYF
jgi:hypothetical protein